jgi:hypothetical protein
MTLSDDPRSFRAPWGPALRWVTLLATALLAGIAILEAVVLPRDLLGGWPWLLATCLPLAILGGSALFTVRGYRFDGSTLLIRRLLWETPLPLDGLRRAWAAPDAMRRSWRLFGNGGLFAISGLYRNRELGNYRAWATRPDLAVVLEFGQRKVVVTPETPARFLQALAVAAPSARLGVP